MECTSHKNHGHEHGPNCGHKGVKHNGHVDYLHDGHLHHVHGGHVDEHRIEVSAANPIDCKALVCKNSKLHAGNAEALPHGDHIDYLVDGRLHHVHGDHCDDHGPVVLA
jgi:hypothetical protein